MTDWLNSRLVLISFTSIFSTEKYDEEDIDSSDDDDDDDDDTMLPVAVSEDLLGDIDDDDPIHQLVSIAAPWFEEAMNTEIQEVHPNLIDFDEEKLFSGKVAHNLDGIIGDLTNIIFGEFVVLFVKEMKSYAKHLFLKRRQDRTMHPSNLSSGEPRGNPRV